MRVKFRLARIVVLLYTIIAVSSVFILNTVQAKNIERKLPTAINNLLNDDECIVSHFALIDISIPSQENLLANTWQDTDIKLNQYLIKAMANRAEIFLACQVNQSDVLSSQYILLDLGSLTVIWRYLGSKYSTLNGGFKTHQIRLIRGNNNDDSAPANIELLQTTLPAKHEKPYMPGPPLTLLFSYQESIGYVKTETP